MTLAINVFIETKDAINVHMKYKKENKRNMLQTN